MATLKTTIEYNGTTWTITANEGTGGIFFNIDPNKEKAGDIRGLFFDLADDAKDGIGPIDTGGILKSDTDPSDGFQWYGGDVLGVDITEVAWGENLVDTLLLRRDANIKGEEPSNGPVEGYAGPNIFDLGIGFGTPGASPDFINSTSFTVKGITLADLANQFFALRLTSTGEDGEGSLKLVGQFTYDDSSDKLYQGFTRGSWLNGARSDDLTGLFNGEPPSYETLFLKENTALSFQEPGRNGATFENPTLREALGLTGGGINQLAAQSTAAYLNALYLENDGDPLTAYSLTKDVVKGLTAAVLNEGNLGGTVDLSDYWWYKDTNNVRGFQEDDTLVFGSTDMGKKELTQLFDFYNNFGTNPAEFMLNPSPQPLVV